MTNTPKYAWIIDLENHIMPWNVQISVVVSTSEKTTIWHSLRKTNIFKSHVQSASKFALYSSYWTLLLKYILMGLLWNILWCKQNTSLVTKCKASFFHMVCDAQFWPLKCIKLNGLRIHKWYGCILLVNFVYTFLWTYYNYKVKVSRLLAKMKDTLYFGMEGIS
jgi:hypothetical protein